jgi:hypothetical protein
VRRAGDVDIRGLQQQIPRKFPSRTASPPCARPVRGENRGRGFGLFSTFSQGKSVEPNCRTS